MVLRVFPVRLLRLDRDHQTGRQKINIERNNNHLCFDLITELLKNYIDLSVKTKILLLKVLVCSTIINIIIILRVQRSIIN